MSRFAEIEFLKNEGKKLKAKSYRLFSFPIAVSLPLKQRKIANMENIYTWAKKNFPHPINNAIIEEIIFSDNPRNFIEVGREFSRTRQAIQYRYKKIMKKLQTQFAEDQQLELNKR